MLFGGSFSRLVSATVIVCAPFLFSATASAGPVSYELRICEDAYCTLNPNDPVFAQQAGNLSQHELFSMRDMPYMQLMNTSPAGSNAEIQRFSITIGDLANNAHHYDWVKMVDFSPGITWQFVMPDTANGGVRSDAIDIIFTGFTPGKLIRFQTDIDNDQGAVDVFTDYRQVLFDLGGTTTTDNALVTTVFSEPGLPPAVSREFLPDFAQVGPTNLGFRLISECGPESVNPYISSGSAIVIPEPATFGLLGIGLVGLIGIACRRNSGRI
jgi:hypothetical protein